MTDTHQKAGVRAARGGRARPVRHAHTVSPEILARSRALEAPVVALFNQHRAALGLPPLTADPKLAEVAAAHSADMLQRGYFAHDDAHGTWDARIRRAVTRSEVGEILSFGSGEYATPAGMVKSWMQSREHRGIILTADLRRVGLGVATGTFEGQDAVSLATADFSS
ncbi:MAG: hypothetical protein QOI71_2825 [Gaiellales bacterium]|jgi:uncharacterized protein YkwD|nr:hypothetical protein [Gaiellales bacterium]